LTVASASSVLGAAVPAVSEAAAGLAVSRSQTPGLRKSLISYTAEDHRRRLENIGVCERGIETCLGRHLTTSYLHAIPYMQFPFLSAGRPFTGERAAIPGIEYTLDRKDFWSRHYLAIREHYKAHPDGPYSYSQWDSAIPRPDARPTHERWLKQYLPMVEEGTWAWLEMSESSLLTAALPENVVASVFANRELYLVLANYSNTPTEVATADAYVRVDEASEQGRTTWQLPARSLHILRRQRDS